MRYFDGFSNGWRRIHGQWVADEVLAAKMAGYPGTPKLKTEPLPICHECQLNEVVPGEDACRSCLGTPEPPWEFDFTVNAVTITPSYGQFSINGLDVYKSITDLQAQVKVLNENLKPWWKFWGS